MSQRQNSGVSAQKLTILPMEHDFPVPKPPAGVVFTTQERKTWRDLWRSPQASQWDESYGVAVATYVLYSSRLFAGEGAAWLAQEHRHIGESLGLTPRGMAALRWQMEGMS